MDYLAQSDSANAFPQHSPEANGLNSLLRLFSLFAHFTRVLCCIVYASNLNLPACISNNHTSPRMYYFAGQTALRHSYFSRSLSSTAQCNTPVSPNLPFLQSVPSSFLSQIGNSTKLDTPARY